MSTLLPSWMPRLCLPVVLFLCMVSSGSLSCSSRSNTNSGFFFVSAQTTTTSNVDNDDETSPPSSTPLPLLPLSSLPDSDADVEFRSEVKNCLSCFGYTEEGRYLQASGVTKSSYCPRERRCLPYPNCKNDNDLYSQNDYGPYNQCSENICVTRAENCVLRIQTEEQRDSLNTFAKTLTAGYVASIVVSILCYIGCGVGAAVALYCLVFKKKSAPADQPQYYPNGAIVVAPQPGYQPPPTESNLQYYPQQLHQQNYNMQYQQPQQQQPAYNYNNHNSVGGGGGAGGGDTGGEHKLIYGPSQL